jgi:hypothetical protein
LRHKIMAVYGTIQELKNAITDTIYENSAGLITADILQDRLIDMIDTIEAQSFSIDGAKDYLESANDLTQLYIGSTKAATQGWVESLGYLTQAELPMASATVLGCIKVGANLTIDVNGVLNAEAGEGGAGTWGSIGGDIADQTDLATALGLLAPIDAPSFTTEISVTGDAFITGRVIAGGLAAIDSEAQFQGKIDTSLDYQYLLRFKDEAGTIGLLITNGAAGGSFFPVFTGKVTSTLPGFYFVGNCVNGPGAGAPIMGFDGRRNNGAANADDILIGFSSGYGSIKAKIMGNGDFITNGSATVSNTSNTAITNYGGVSKNNYVSQLTGYRVSAAGEADFRYLYADELHVKSFIADLEQALAGGQIIAKSVAKVAADFTIPAAGAAQTLVVEEFAGYTGAVFANGDTIRLRQFSRANNTTLDVADVWGTVVYVSRDATANPTTQSFTFTRSAAPNAGSGSGTIKTGSLALDYGTSGNGYYEVTAVDGVNGANSPYSQFVTWTGHPATGLTLKARIGNLAGITDADFGGALSGYGLYGNNVYLKGNIQIVSGSVPNNLVTGLGSLATKSAVDLNSAEVTNKSLANLDSTANTKLSGIAAGATVGATWGTNLYSIPATLGAPSGTGLFLSATNMGYYTASAWKTYIDSSGNMILGDIAGGNTGISWNQATGVLSIKGAISITNTIPSGSVSGLGSLATKSSVDLNSGEVTNKSLANLDSTANTKLSGIAAGATVGATWGTNLYSTPAYLGSPSAAGLYIDGTHMGYYTGAAWSSYIDSSGNCRFVGVAEFGTATASYGGKDSNIGLKNADIWENAYDGDGSAVHINRIGHAGSADHYRDFVVYDGKGHKVFQIGSSATPNIVFGNTSDPVAVAFDITGSLTVSGASILNGSLECNSTAQFDGAATFNSSAEFNSTTQFDGLSTFNAKSTYYAGLVVASYTQTQFNNDAMGAVAGMICYNSTTGHFYGYTNAWRQLD